MIKRQIDVAVAGFNIRALWKYERGIRYFASALGAGVSGIEQRLAAWRQNRVKQSEAACEYETSSRRGWRRQAACFAQSDWAGISDGRHIGWPIRR